MSPSDDAAVLKLSRSLDAAVDSVRAGGVLAYPTEAVFGLGCNPHHLSAVQRLLGIKQRSADKGLILLAANINQLADFVPPLDEEIWERVAPTWPGPITWLLPVKKTVSPLVRGNHNTLAVRISDHPVCQQLCQRLGHPLVSTSANLSGYPAATTAMQVAQQLGQQIDLILDKPLGDRQHPSEIRHAITNEILRKG